MAEENYDESMELEEDIEESPPFDFEDEFDRLRQKTARTSAVYDDMEMDDELIVEDERSFFEQISPGQRLVLLLVLLLDIVVIAVGFMALFNVI
jgi:hypothetical protein